MRIEGIFPVPFLFDFLDIDNQKLIEYSYVLKKNNPGSPRNGGWQSEWLNLEAQELQPLVSIIKTKMQETATNLYQFHDDYTINLKNGWININEPKGEQLNNNYYHMHGPYFISMVYYIQTAENCGKLNLVPPHGFLDYTIPEQLLTNLNPFNSQRYQIDPAPGKLVAFPAWITHFADINNSDVDRISIAFNGMLELKGK